LVVEEDQEQCQRSKPLLSVDDELLPILVADDDRPQEVVAVVRDGAALVAFLVALEEFIGEVLDEFGDLLLLPFVLALIIVDRILVAREELSDRSPLAVDRS
jgi:hypothetical protein